MKAALLPDRGVIKVAGADARDFLNGMLTSDIAAVAPGVPRFAALLTPQGKIIVDCIVSETPDGTGKSFFLDCPRPLAAALTTKLNFYKLRAKVLVEDLSETLGVMAAWDGVANAGLCNPDPRLAALGCRIIVPPQQAAATAVNLGATLVEAAEYETHRIALGVPRGGMDFIYGDVFPHEADMDQLGGVDFRKGCYVGQEVVSRMEHRGTARTRIMAVSYQAAAPDTGVPVLAGDKPVGTMGSAAAGRGLALLRLDRVAEASAAGVALTAGGVPVTVRKPDWARFELAAAPVETLR